MRDVEASCRNFVRILEQQKGRNVAVYGLGEYASLIAERFGGNIAVFLDRERCSGEFCGKPVISMEDLTNVDISALAIVASFSAESFVYERVHAFCETHGIALYGLHSGDLRAGRVGKLVSLSAVGGQERRATLWQEIERHDVISFDIFDTLLQRRTLYPADVFEIVAYRARKEGLALPSGFQSYRAQAEYGASVAHKGLSRIYSELGAMLGWDRATGERVRDLEMQVETEVLFPRSSMVEAFHYAVSLGKKVLLVSDMYLPENFLRDVLDRNSISGFAGMYVSDACGTGKKEELFAIVRRQHPAVSYLHIGDNMEADGWGARCHGMDAFLIQSALEMFRASGASQPFKYLDGLNERLLVGGFLAKAYADPFATDGQGRRWIKDVADYAGMFLSALAVSYLWWLLGKAREGEYDAVLFAARDGYLFLKMYEDAVKEFGCTDAPPGLYFYASRRLCLASTIKTAKDWDWCKVKTGNGLEDFLHKTLRLRERVGQKNVAASATTKSCQALSPEITARSREIRQGYMLYMQKIGIRPEGRYALLDLDSHGTTQYALGKLLPRLHGLYFHRSLAEENFTMGSVETFLPQSDSIMLACYAFEFVFSSPEPSVHSMMLE